MESVCAWSKALSTFEKRADQLSKMRNDLSSAISLAESMQSTIRAADGGAIGNHEPYVKRVEALQGFIRRASEINARIMNYQDIAIAAARENLAVIQECVLKAAQSQRQTISTQFVADLIFETSDEEKAEIRTSSEKAAKEFFTASGIDVVPIVEATLKTSIVERPGWWSGLSDTQREVIKTIIVSILIPFLVELIIRAVPDDTSPNITINQYFSCPAIQTEPSEDYPADENSDEPEIRTI